MLSYKPKICFNFSVFGFAIPIVPSSFVSGDPERIRFSAARVLVIIN